MPHAHIRRSDSDLVAQRLPPLYHSPIEQHALYNLMHRHFHIHALVLLTTRKLSAQTQFMAEFAQLRC